MIQYDYNGAFYIKPDIEDFLSVTAFLKENNVFYRVVKVFNNNVAGILTGKVDGKTKLSFLRTFQSQDLRKMNLL